MTDDILMDRIYNFFNYTGADNIDREEWVVGFNIFLKGFHLIAVVEFFYEHLQGQNLSRQGTASTFTI